MLASLLCVAAAVLTLMPSSALKTHLTAQRQRHAPGAHLLNLAGEAFEVGSPGEYMLLRVPREHTKPALIRVGGNFVAAAYAPCVPYLEKVTIHGDWLGNRMVHLGLWNGSLAMKVSSRSPAFAGPWRSAGSFGAQRARGLEALPATAQVSASVAAGGPKFEFRVGPKGGDRSLYPVVSVAQGLHEGLDVSLSNLWSFQSMNLSNVTLTGLLSNEKHNESVELHTAECEVHQRRMSTHLGASDALSSWSLQPTYLRNLADEDFLMNRSGDFELLRAPKPRAQPALIQARGTFASADNASCVVYLTSVTLRGEWFGGKVVHVRSLNGSFAIKVSSADPPVAGTWRTIDTFMPDANAREALPETVQVTADVSVPAFKFQLRPKNLESRPSFVVTQALHGGLNISLSDMKSVDMPKMAGLMGTDKHDKALDHRTAECEAELQRLRQPPAGSLLTASWGL